MAGDINRVTLVGRLTRDPELKHLPSGTAVLELGLAEHAAGLRCERTVHAHEVGPGEQRLEFGARAGRADVVQRRA